MHHSPPPLSMPPVITFSSSPLPIPTRAVVEAVAIFRQCYRQGKKEEEDGWRMHKGKKGERETGGKVLKSFFLPPFLLCFLCQRTESDEGAGEKGGGGKEEEVHSPVGGIIWDSTNLWRLVCLKIEAPINPMHLEIDVGKHVKSPFAGGGGARRRARQAGGGREGGREEGRPSHIHSHKHSQAPKDAVPALEEERAGSG